MLGAQRLGRMEPLELYPRRLNVASIERGQVRNAVTLRAMCDFCAKEGTQIVVGGDKYTCRNADDAATPVRGPVVLAATAERVLDRLWHCAGARVSVGVRVEAGIDGPVAGATDVCVGARDR